MMKIIPVPGKKTEKQKKLLRNPTANLNSTSHEVLFD